MALREAEPRPQQDTVWVLDALIGKEQRWLEARSYFQYRELPSLISDDLRDDERDRIPRYRWIYATAFLRCVAIEPHVSHAIAALRGEQQNALATWPLQSDLIDLIWSFV